MYMNLTFVINTLILKSYLARLISSEEMNSKKDIYTDHSCKLTLVDSFQSMLFRAKSTPMVSL